MAALIAAEIGGANAMAPIITAALAGLPVIDGDGMGRAFPEVQMTTFAIYGDGSREGLTAIADDKGNVVVIRKYIDVRWLERFARTIVVDMGAGAGAAGAPMPMEFVRRAAIPNTVTQALEIGHTVLNARAKRQNVVERVVDVTRGKLFFIGKIVDVARELKGGFVRGQANLSGLDQWAGSQARIAIQNENLVLWIDGVPVDHGAGPHHESGTRHRRADHHRDAALRPARGRHRNAGARPDANAGRARSGRPARVRLSGADVCAARCRCRLNHVCGELIR